MRTHITPDSTTFHMGTGDHHYLGRQLAEAGMNTFAVTNTPLEYKAYIDGVIKHPEVAHRYLCYFGDIYLINPPLIPTLDYACLFHLCEFTEPRRADYGGFDDLEVLMRLSFRLNPNGRIVMYTGSSAWPKAEQVIASAPNLFEQAGDYKSLRFYKSLIPVPKRSW